CGDDGRDSRRCGRRGTGRRRPCGARLRCGVRGMTRSRWVVRGLLLFVLAFANLNDIRAGEATRGGEAPGLWSPDVLPNALFAWTVIREHDVDYDEFTAPGGTTTGKLDREAYFFRACGVSTATAPPTAKRSQGGPPAPGPNDHVCSVFPPGMGILALPFFAPFVLTGANPLDLGLLVHGGHVVAAIVEILATLILWSVLRRFATPRWSLVPVLLYFLATSVRTVASQALWQHSGVHLAVPSALWLTLREEPIPLSRDRAAGVALAGRGRGASPRAFAGVARRARALRDLRGVVGRPRVRLALPGRFRADPVRRDRLGHVRRPVGIPVRPRRLQPHGGVVVRALPGGRVPLRQGLGHRPDQRERRPVEALQLERSAVARRSPARAFGGRKRHRRRRPQRSCPGVACPARAACVSRE